MAVSNATQAVLMTISEFGQWSRLGRTSIYQELNAGRLRATKIGARTYIRTVDAEAWLADCPAYSEVVPVFWTGC